ncbi:MAG: hypothetical protein GXY83_27835 [Rhodopirellula sp.]|nr:hypothetical protein [Rhodopirellula sp.]
MPTTKTHPLMHIIEQTEEIVRGVKTDEDTPRGIKAMWTCGVLVAEYARQNYGESRDLYKLEFSLAELFAGLTARYVCPIPDPLELKPSLAALGCHRFPHLYHLLQELQLAGRGRLPGEPDGDLAHQMAELSQLVREMARKTSNQSDWSEPMDKADVAEEINRSLKTLGRWVEEGKIQLKPCGGKWRYRLPEK